MTNREAVESFTNESLIDYLANHHFCPLQSDDIDYDPNTCIGDHDTCEECIRNWMTGELDVQVGQVRQYKTFCYFVIKSIDGDTCECIHDDGEVVIFKVADMVKFPLFESGVTVEDFLKSEEDEE